VGGCGVRAGGIWGGLGVRVGDDEGAGRRTDV